MAESEKNPQAEIAESEERGKNNFLYAVQVVTGKFISTTGIPLLWLKKIYFIVTMNFGNSFYIVSNSQ